MNEDATQDLLRKGPRVANVGISTFADELNAQKAEVIQVDWTPPVELSPDLKTLLDDLL
jgi:hypothetical protein